MSKPWNENWNKMDRIGSGGQGIVNIVENKTSGTVGALKLLKSQKDLERRSRMFREVSTMISLENSNQNIPKVIEHNVNEWKNISTPLYVVFEYIEGVTLEEYISENGVITLDHSISFIKELLKIIETCHANGIMHRDIKPDNIILKGAELQKPYLIDFGLTFNKEIEDSGDTLSEQQIGNRFLSLPELTTPSSSPQSKRQFVSDITQLIGVLFYSLTTTQPMTLIDDEGKMPHQRIKINHNDKPKLIRLEELFSSGFAYETRRRIKSASNLLNWLEEIDNPKSNNMNETKSAISEFKSKILNSDIQLERLKEEACLDVLNKTISRFKNFVLKSTDNSFVANQSGRYNGGYSNISGLFHFGVNVHEPRDYIKNQRFHLIGSWEEDILVIHVAYKTDVNTIKSIGFGSEGLLVEHIECLFDKLLGKIIQEFSKT